MRLSYEVRKKGRLLGSGMSPPMPREVLTEWKRSKEKPQKTAAFLTTIEKDVFPTDAHGCVKAYLILQSSKNDIIIMNLRSI